MQDYSKLKVWEKAHQLTLSWYQETSKFPDEEKYGMISQIRRAATSIGTNIAGGCGRNTQKEFIHFLHIASGSTFELEYLTILSKDLHYLNTDSYQNMFNEVKSIKKMLFSLIETLKSDH